MIYVFKDGSGYQEFPTPKDMTRFLAVDGTTEQRIKAGDRYRLLNDGDVLEFLSPQEVNAEALAKAQAGKRSEIDGWRKAAEAAGFTHTFPDDSTGTVQTRERDMTNIIGLVVGAQANPGASFEFRDGEDVTHTLTAEQVLTLGTVAQAFISSNYQHQWALKDQVASATTVAEVEAVTWE